MGTLQDLKIGNQRRNVPLYKPMRNLAEGSEMLRSPPTVSVIPIFAFTCCKTSHALFLWAADPNVNAIDGSTESRTDYE